MQEPEALHRHGRLTRYQATKARHASACSAAHSIHKHIYPARLCLVLCPQELSHQDIIRQLKLEHAKEITKLRQEFELQVCVAWVTGYVIATIRQ